MKTWKVKDGEKKNRNGLGTTDYDIPMITYKSAFLILVLSTIFIMLGQFISKSMTNWQQVTEALIGGLGFAISFGISRYFIDTKRGPTKGFWITSVLAFIIGSLFILAFLKLNILF